MYSGRIPPNRVMTSVFGHGRSTWPIKCVYQTQTSLTYVPSFLNIYISLCPFYLVSPKLPNRASMASYIELTPSLSLNAARHRH